ncbi:hypothetical protein ABT218_28650 [Streptomyces sp. NPDC001455]|uniref:hypothetical protein n=1 Tax=Streptomyces sp. NPDC001455 TaxID=3154518 RepID=UPI003323FF09
MSAQTAVTEPAATTDVAEPAPTPASADTGAGAEKSPSSGAGSLSVAHTPGGWPVVPLATTGVNTGTSLLATAALVGGPAALAVAATGAVVLGTAAATRKHRGKKKPGKTPRRAMRSAAGSGSTGRTPHRGGAGRVPTQPRNGSSRTRKAAGSSRGKSPLGSAGSLPGAGKSGGPRHGASGLRKPSAQRTPAGVLGASRGRLGEVRSLRESARKSAPSRADRRADTAGTRRAVADARRDAKSAARSGARSRKGPLGRSVGKAAGRVGALKGALIDRNRAARDRQAAGKVAAQRDAVRKAPARKKARRALWRSAARFQGRRLLAALFAGALGVVGMVSTPLGRKLGWAWLQYPGRRLYARMTRTAEERRQDRDDAIRAALKDDEAAADAEAADCADEVGDVAERPKGPTPAAPTTTTTTSSSEGENVSGFRFEEYAAEMEAAAGQYDPENAMEILAMVDGLPAALTSVANVMKILAERADSEFPLEKPVADAFNDVFASLMSAVEAAEHLAPTFRIAHDQDIARHEDPRNGIEAEKGWNV